MECPRTWIGYIRGSCISQFGSSCLIAILTYSMTSTQNYFVAPEFARCRDQLDSSLTCWAVSLACCSCFFSLDYLKSRCDVHIFNGKVPANSDIEDNVIVSLQNFVSNFPERLPQKKVTTPRWVVFSNYKTPWPLRRNWRLSVPGNLLQTNPDYTIYCNGTFGALTCAECMATVEKGWGKKEVIVLRRNQKEETA